MKPGERSLFLLSNNNSYFAQLQVITLGSRTQTDMEEQMSWDKRHMGDKLMLNLH